MNNSITCVFEGEQSIALKNKEKEEKTGSVPHIFCSSLTTKVLFDETEET
jgi:hypothetical protein